MSELDRALPEISVADKREPLLVTVEVAAALLSVSRATLYVLLSKGILPSLTIGRSRRMSVAALRELIAVLEDVAPGRCS